MKPLIRMMLLTTFVSPIVSANTAECLKKDGQGIPEGETLKVSVINQAGQVVRSHVICDIEQGVLHTSTKHNTSSAFFGSASAPNGNKASDQQPRQQVLNTYELTEVDGTLVMVMVIGYFKAGETTAFDTKVVESRFPAAKGPVLTQR
jgi:hypothetical protein